MEPLAVAPIIEEIRSRARLRGGDLDPAEARDVLGNPIHDLTGYTFPELMGPERDWKVDAPLSFQPRPSPVGSLLVMAKQRLVLPLVRWLYEYTSDNFKRQQRVNLVLLTAVEELAKENARLRRAVADAATGVLAPPAVPVAPPPQPLPELPPSSARRLRLAFVVQRYGADIHGGSERHCREVCERLAERHDVTVLTSTARDHLRWENAYPVGEERVAGVRVVRFPVAEPRDLEAFSCLSKVVFAGCGSDEGERRWFRLNGPYVPTLIDHVRAHRDDFDLFVFFAYRYFPSFAGVHAVPDKAILFPTAEEDPAMRLRATAELFRKPLGILHNSLEERDLMQRLTEGPLPPAAVVGCGVKEPAPFSEAVLQGKGIREPFALYLGRVDPNKGAEALLHGFRRQADALSGRIQLVVAGTGTVPIPAHPDILPLGYVGEELREALLARAFVLVMPSLYESLSLVVLEAWARGRPVLVNGRCAVLAGHVARAQGGITYDGAAELREALRYLLDHPDVASRLGAQGRAYVEREYRWPVVMDRIERFLQERAAAARQPAAVQAAPR